MQVIINDLNIRILIFVLYKKEAVDLQNKLQAKGYHVTAIHGDKSQVPSKYQLLGISDY